MPVKSQQVIEYLKKLFGLVLLSRWKILSVRLLILFGHVLDQIRRRKHRRRIKKNERIQPKQRPAVVERCRLLFKKRFFQNHWKSFEKLMVMEKSIFLFLLSLKWSRLLFLETNIDEILNLPDLAGVPNAFLTEIEQDQVYETIYQELQKKLPRRNSPPTLVLPDDDQQKALSPRLLAVDDDDDDRSSLTDELSSSLSEDNNQASSKDDYDTDIESGSNRLSSPFSFWL